MLKALFRSEIVSTSFVSNDVISIQAICRVWIPPHVLKYHRIFEIYMYVFHNIYEILWKKIALMDLDQTWLDCEGSQV